MKSKLQFIIVTLSLVFSLTAHATDWKDLIGKELVLDRWGNVRDGWFSDYHPMNTMGADPVERIILKDATHVVWNYTQQGDFAHECSLQGPVLTFNEPIFGNKEMRILKAEGDVILTLGGDSLTRAFYILNPQPDAEQLPASADSKRGFCNGKLKGLLPHFTDLTYSSRTPMGRHFQLCKQAKPEERLWLESTKEVFDDEGAQIKAYDISLFPNGKPVLADIQKEGMIQVNALGVLKDMACMYPGFIKSVIRQEAPDSFRIDMFDPDGNPIRVCVSNRFPQIDKQIFSTGENGTYNWLSILEKAIMKWLNVYNNQMPIASYCAEWITPMFTGDGRSFCIQPGRLTGKELAKVVNTCRQNGMMVNGVADSRFTSLSGTPTVTNPDMAFRIISPGAAAKYFDRNAVNSPLTVVRTFKPEELYPSNWRNTQTGDWEIGFFNDFAIYDCQFWNYKQKQQKGDKYSLVLENNGRVITVNVGKPKNGLRRLEIAGKKADYDIINTKTLPDYPVKDTRTDFVDNGYKTDTITIIGWLKDMPEQDRKKKSEVEAHYSNILKNKQENAFASIDSLGRFVLRFPILNTTPITLIWYHNYIWTVVEPGQTYFLFSDSKSGQKLLMGKDVRMQNEMLKYPLDTETVYMGYDDTDFDRFLASTDSLLKKLPEKLQWLKEEHPMLSDRYLRYRKGNTFWNQARNVGQSRFRNENYHLPDNVRRFASDTFWAHLEKPYTLYMWQEDFLDDYLTDAVKYYSYTYSYKLFDLAEEYAANEKERAVIVRWKEWILKAQESIKQAATQEEKTRIAEEENSRNADLIKEVEKILNSPRARKTISGKSFLSELEKELHRLDSLGTDSVIRDLFLTSQAWGRLEGNHQSFLPEVIDTLKKIISLPASMELIENRNNYYLALENREFDKLVLKSSDSLNGISEGETLLQKILEPYKGKIVLLDVWGTWCGPCRAALSHSQEEYERLKDYDIQYLYLAKDSPQEAWENTIKEYNVTGDNVAHYNLPGEQQDAIERYLNIHSWPSYRLFDRNGNLLDMDVDGRDLEGLASLLEQLK